MMQKGAYECYSNELGVTQHRKEIISNTVYFTRCGWRTPDLISVERNNVQWFDEFLMLLLP